MISIAHGRNDLLTPFDPRVQTFGVIVESSEIFIVILKACFSSPRVTCGYFFSIVTISENSRKEIFKCNGVTRAKIP